MHLNDIVMFMFSSFFARERAVTRGRSRRPRDLHRQLIWIAVPTFLILDVGASVGDVVTVTLDGEGVLEVRRPISLFSRS